MHEAKNAEKTPIRAPTLIVVGDQHVPSILEICELRQAKIPARRVVIQGVAHMLNMENMMEFNRLILDFIEEPSRRETLPTHANPGTS